MIFKQLVMGYLDTNCYMIRGAESRKALLIDPGGDIQPVLDILEKRGLKLEAVILTHAHGDHLAGLPDLLRMFHLKVILHMNEVFLLERELGSLPQGLCKVLDGEEMKLGGLMLKFIHTPGHTPGGLSLVVNEKAVFSGDTLFAEGIGRTDFSYGSLEDIQDSIYKKLLRLPESMLLLPGHGFISTIEAVKCDNPYLDHNYMV